LAPQAATVSNFAAILAPTVLAMRGNRDAVALDQRADHRRRRCCFYLIDKFVRDGRLANLLKILVALICVLAILQRLLPALGLSGLL